MNNVYIKSSVVIICCLFFISKNHSYAQNTTDSTVAEVSEIIIPQGEKIKHQKSLYYEVYTSQDHFPVPAYWYKIIFIKDCSFHFSLFPLYEEDTYDLYCFKIPSDIDVCSAITRNKTISCNTERVYKDYNDEEVKNKPESKFLDLNEVQVKAGDAIYIEIFSTSGKDCGHILEFKTSSSFFVVKLINRKCPTPELYSTDQTIPVKQYKTVETEKEAIEILNTTFCKLKENKLLVTSIKMNNKIVSFNPGLDFVSYTKKRENAKKREEAALPVKPLPTSTIVVPEKVSYVEIDTIPVIKIAADTTKFLAKKVEKPIVVKSTADLEDLPQQQTNQTYNGAIKHSRLDIDNVLFSLLVDDLKEKTTLNNEQIKEYTGKLKRAGTKEEKAEITASIKEVRQQITELQEKTKEAKLKLKNIQKLSAEIKATKKVKRN